MTTTGDFAKLVPGFDFLQGLVKNAGAALPGMGQWIAPTLDPDELDKRIDQLKTVQFWLEQNARMIGATIQALEVQRMTLSTLRSMNLPVADVAEAFRARTPLFTPQPAPTPPPAETPAAAPAPAEAPRRKAGRSASSPPGPARPPWRRGRPAWPWYPRGPRADRPRCRPPGPVAGSPSRHWRRAG